LTYPSFITVHQTPTADIDADNQILYPGFTTLTVTNASTGAVSYQWNLDLDNNWYGYFQPGTFNYPANVKDTFLITLIASSEEGCKDTAYQSIIFRNDPFYYVPNTFVPDGNIINDVWYVVFSDPSNVRSFLVRVYNRWGEIVYESRDFTEGWDGTYRGNRAQDGTYIWIMQFEWEDKRVFDDKGHVNILR
jgi:gliding motility-associated-like protein